MLYRVERQTKYDRPSKCDLENRLTFEIKTWYTIKEKSLPIVHFHAIITYYFHMAYNKGIVMAVNRKHRKIVTGPKWRIILTFLLNFLNQSCLYEQ